MKLLVVAAILFLMGCGGSTHRSSLREPAGSNSCGVERAAVKHLTDGFALPAKVTKLTIDQMVNMTAPPVTQNSPRFPQEQIKAQLTDVHVVGVKQEPDSDLHIIISTSSGTEMNVESPAARCDATSPAATYLANARAAADAAMPHVSSSHYTGVNFYATIRGMVFFDVLHGQRGALNGIELHPVTLFKTVPASTP